MKIVALLKENSILNARILPQSLRDSSLPEGAFRALFYVIRLPDKAFKALPLGELREAVRGQITQARHQHISNSPTNPNLKYRVYNYVDILLSNEPKK